MSSYDELYRGSIDDPAAFWSNAAEAVSWTRKPQVVLDDSQAPLFRWFPDGELNTCFNALDRHVELGRAEQAALIYDSPVSGSARTYTYRELLDETARFAGVLSELGVTKGDRVVVYMPMIPEAVIAMLACARIGAVHSVVFGGFAAHELATRIDDARPAVLISASCGIEPSRTVPYKPMIDAALDAAEHPPRHCVIVQRDRMRCELTPDRDVDWQEAMAGAEPHDPVPVAATDPLYVLYTSGTTGRPKGIVRDNGGHAVALLWTMRHVYGIAPGEVFWAASDVGWVVGHSYIVYAPLLLGATTVLYEGKPVGTPDPGALWRVISEHGVKALFTAPPRSGPSARRTPTVTTWRSTTWRAGSTFSSPASGWTRTPTTGRRRSSALPSSITAWQTETGGRSPPTRSASSALPFKAGSRRCRCPVTTSASWTPTEASAGRARRVRCASGCRCRRAPSRRCGATTPAYEASYLTEYPGYYLSGTVATSTRTATSS